MERRIMLMNSRSLLLLFSTFTFLIHGAALGQSPASQSTRMKKKNSAHDRPILSPDKTQILNSFALSIYVDETVFSLHSKPEVLARLENRSGKSANLKKLSAISFNLSKYGKDKTDYRSGELFVSYFPLPDRRIKDGETVEFKVDLTMLTWQDSISSASDFRNTKNMAEVVNPGDYYLFMGLELRAENRTKESPRFINIKSNEVLVRWLGR